MIGRSEDGKLRTKCASNPWLPAERTLATVYYCPTLVIRLSPPLLRIKMRLSLLLGLGGALLAGARPLGSDSIVDLSGRSFSQVKDSICSRIIS